MSVDRCTASALVPTISVGNDSSPSAFRWPMCACHSRREARAATMANAHERASHDRENSPLDQKDNARMPPTPSETANRIRRNSSAAVYR